MNAKDALELAKEFNKEGLKDILTVIEQAAREGKTFIYIKNDIKETIIAELHDLGYKIEFLSQSKIKMCITWL